MKRIIPSILLGVLLVSGTAYAQTAGSPTQPDNTKTPLNFWASGYEAQWLSQTQASAFEGAKDDGDEYFDVKPGDTVTFDAKFKNTSKETWYPTSADRQVCINIYKDPKVTSAPAGTGYDDPKSPKFGRSFWADPSWAIQDYRIGCINEASVAPGATGSFTMKFAIPANTPPGSYREDITLASGPYWMANTTNGDPIGAAHIWVGFDVKTFGVINGVKISKTTTATTQDVKIQFAVFGLSYAPNANGQNAINLSQDIEVLDPQGTIMPQLSQKGIVTSTQTITDAEKLLIDTSADNAFLVLYNTLRFPIKVVHGTYTAKITVHDILTGKQSVSSIPFTL
ncbi:MAG: hypothetical protein WCP97_06860 [bacterium]